MTCFFPAAQRGLVRMRRKPVCPAVPTVPVPEKTPRSRTTGCGAIQKIAGGTAPANLLCAFLFPAGTHGLNVKFSCTVPIPYCPASRENAVHICQALPASCPAPHPTRTRCCRNITNISFPQPVHSARAHRVTGPDTTANVLPAVVFSSRPMSGAAACCGKKPCGPSHNAMKSTPPALPGTEHRLCRNCAKNRPADQRHNNAG
jgi:hypothetical protein